MDGPAQLSRRQLAILILGLMATAIGQSLVFAILAPLGREVQLQELQITSIIAVSALVYGLAAPRWGRASDLRGRRPIMITGLLGYTLGTLAFASVFLAGLKGLLTGTLLYVVLLATRCVQALIMSGTNPASTAYAADHTEPRLRTRTMAKLGTANNMGTILGPAVSGALATFGLLAPLYFAAALTLIAAWVVWRYLPRTPTDQRVRRAPRKKLRYTDPRIALLLLTTTGIFVGFSAIQQTLGFQLQDKLQLSGIQTAQYTGAALMVSAISSFLVQLTVMQRLQLKPTQFVRIGLLSLLAGAAAVGQFETFAVLAVGMALLGAGLALCMPAIAAGASLAVEPPEQGAAAGLVSSCPPLGFAIGSVCAGALYQVDGALAALFGAVVFFAVLVNLVYAERRRARH